MNHRIGRITLALALIGVGAVLVYDNALGTNYFWSLAQLWPLLLIGLGLEWVVAGSRPQGRAQADGAAIALLIIGMLIIGVSTVSVRTVNTFHWNLGSAPPMPPLPPNPPVNPPLEFSILNRSSAEVVKVYDPEMTGLDHLVIDGGSAAVVVEPGERLNLELTVKAWGSSEEAARSAAQTAGLVIAPGATTNVQLRLPSSVAFDALTIRVTVPEGTNLTVNTSSGAIQVRDHEGNLTARSVSGAVVAESVEGLVDLRSSSGGIMAREITGDLTAISSSGAVRAERVMGDVQAATTSGSVYLADLSGKVSAHSSSGSVSVETATVGGDYDLGAVSGPVRFVFPRDASMIIDGRSSSGTVSGPGWLLLGEGRGSATGTLGEGLHKATIRTTSGTIALSER